MQNTTIVSYGFVRSSGINVETNRFYFSRTTLYYCFFDTNGKEMVIGKKTQEYIYFFITFYAYYDFMIDLKWHGRNKILPL